MIGLSLQGGVGHPHLSALGEPAGLALLPVGGGHLARSRLAQRPAAERFVLVSNLAKC